MQIILHPGFHKTGSSSLQAFLAANRTVLRGHMRIVMLDELADPVRSATRFAAGRDGLDLAAFSAGFAKVCQGLAGGAAQTIVISCEGLSGRTPGKNGIADYGAAVPLAAAMGRCMRAVFGRKVDLTYLYTTRAALPWLNSAWRHNLLGYRITQDFAAFCADYARAADFGAITDQVARLVHQARVVVTPLELVLDQPAKAVLQLLNLPDGVHQTLRDPGPKNAGISQALAADLLAINRSCVTDAKAKAMKANALRLAR